MVLGHIAYLALIGAAMFSGAVVSGAIGFGFSAIAGVIILHVMLPVEAVPLMMACGALVQISSLSAVVRGVQWKRCLVFAAGGLPGIVPAIYLLQHLNTDLFRVGIRYSHLRLCRLHAVSLRRRCRSLMPVASSATGSSDSAAASSVD